MLNGVLSSCSQWSSQWYPPTRLWITAPGLQAEWLEPCEIPGPDPQKGNLSNGEGLQRVISKLKGIRGKFLHPNWAKNRQQIRAGFIFHFYYYCSGRALQLGLLGVPGG